MAYVVSRFDDAVEIVLRYLEAQGIGLLEGGMFSPEHFDNLLRVLSSRLHREPFPPKPWFDRVVAIAKRSRSPIGAGLYTEITGRQLTFS
jgi:hypothetical protein